jgi:hypothetical protein
VVRSAVTTIALVLIFALAAVAAGCLGGPLPADRSPTTTAASTTDPPTATPATDVSTGSPTPEPCTARSPEHDTRVPERPRTINRTSARRLAVAVERRYEVAALRDRYENVAVSGTHVREVRTDRIDGGYEVTVTLTVDFSTDRLTASGGYPTTYRVTDRRFVREGRTLACWR